MKIYYIKDYVIDIMNILKEDFKNLTNYGKILRLYEYLKKQNLSDFVLDKKFGIDKSDYKSGIILIKYILDFIL
jgi:hypothetical protein